ncbi:MAG: polysaccharide deacetylase family protein [Clostridioides sp.]|nr:polysaccharide deacetylase family protein [Clostridioides sp.]
MFNTVMIVFLLLVLMFLVHSVIPTYYNKVYNKKALKCVNYKIKARNEKTATTNNYINDSSCDRISEEIHEEINAETEIAKTENAKINQQVNKAKKYIDSNTVNNLRQVSTTSIDGAHESHLSVGLKSHTTQSQFKRIMLTFDDGPDPRYTGELLDILRDNGIRATFFTVAKNAQKNPELIKRMQDEGHVIGIHSLEHKNALLYSYAYTKKDFAKSLEIMKDLGVDVHYYRPPWGHTNIFSTGFIKKYNLRLVLWSLMIEDWEKNTTVELLKTRLKDRLRVNSIICLHDAGENSGGAKNAPKIMIQTLKEVIPELKSEGYEFITPGEDEI